MAKFTVTAPGWKRYKGQISRVPPARSTRQGASAMIAHAEALLYRGSIVNPATPADRDTDEARFVRWRVGGGAGLGPERPRGSACGPQQTTPAAPQQTTLRPASSPIQHPRHPACGLACQAARVRPEASGGVMGKAPTPAASFFTVPWVETPVPFSAPPCDPLPAADLDKLVEQNSQQQGVKRR